MANVIYGPQVENRLRGAPPIPPELAAHLRDIGIALPPPAKSLDDDHNRAVLSGISNQWRPAYPGDEPPF
jgi:hypothetical protein